MIAVMVSNATTADERDMCLTHTGKSVHRSRGGKESSDAVLDLLPHALGAGA